MYKIYMRKATKLMNEIKEKINGEIFDVHE